MAKAPQIKIVQAETILYSRPRQKVAQISPSRYIDMKRKNKNVSPAPSQIENRNKKLSYLSRRLLYAGGLD